MNVCDVCMPSMETLLSPQRTLSGSFIRSHAARLGQCGVWAPRLGKQPVLPPPSPSAAPPLLLQGSSWLVDLEASETLLRALSRIIDIFFKGCVSITPHRVALESCRSELLGFTAVWSRSWGSHGSLNLASFCCFKQEQGSPAQGGHGPPTPTPAASHPALNLRTLHSPTSCYRGVVPVYLG